MAQRAWQKFKVPTARGRKQRTGYSNIGEHSGRQGFAHGYAEQMEKGDIPMTSQEQQRLDHAAVQLEKIFGRKKKWQRNEPYTPEGVYSGSERPSRFRRGLSALGRGARGAASGATRAARATGGAAREFGRGMAQESRAMYGGGKSVMEPSPGAVKELRDRKSEAQNRQTTRLQAENRAANRTDWGKVAAVPEKPIKEGEVRQVHFPPSSKFASGGPKTTNPAYNRPPPQSGGSGRNRFGVRKMEKAMISLQKFLDNDCGCEGDTLMQNKATKGFSDKETMAIREGTVRGVDQRIMMPRTQAEVIRSGGEPKESSYDRKHGRMSRAVPQGREWSTSEPAKRFPSPKND